MLKDAAKKYYIEQNYNCAETLLRAGNEYYGLRLGEREMTMVGAFGGGIQTGSVCGALLSACALLSLRYVEKRAHESTDIKPVVQQMIRRFEEKMGSTLCREIKPRVFRPDVRCMDTVDAACDALEATIAAYEASEKNA